MRAFLLAVLLALPPACTSNPSPTVAPERPTVPPIQVRVYPRVAIPPIDTVRVEVLIAQHPENRKYCIVLDGPGVYSSSCEGLPGSHAAFLYVRAVLGILVEGRYLVKAELYRAQSLDEPYAVTTAVVQAGTELAVSLR